MKFGDFLSRFDKRVKTRTGFNVCCPAHDDKQASLGVAQAKDGGVILKCFTGCATEAVVQAMGLTMSDLFANPKGQAQRPITKPAPSLLQVKKADDEQKREKIKYEIDKIYSYQDALGREVYQAVRLKPKSFRQRHMVNGEWIKNMDGVERVLYQLPLILKSETVWIVEGEKDADNLTSLGFCATCNVGGANKWLDGYTECLAGKHIVICGDNDEPGQKHVDLVFDSVSPKAASVKIVKVPETHKDVSDYIETLKDGAKERLTEMAEEATPHIGGISLPIYSMADIEPFYHKQVTQSATQSFDFADWLPSCRGIIRPMIPGDLALLVGDTGIGKTALLQNVAMSNKSKSLMFSLELPKETIFERYMAIKEKTDAVEIERSYKGGTLGAKAMMFHFPNIFICPESKMTLDRMETLILRSELKIGEKPLLVLVDYVQLIQGRGSRYEKTSDVAEGLKVLAKSTRTIIVVASQVSRGVDKEIGLHSAKDSGSLENSAGIVIGGWRDENDKTLMHLKFLKATKGGAGLELKCNFDGAKSIITERSRVETEE